MNTELRNCRVTLRDADGTETHFDAAEVRLLHEPALATNAAAAINQAAATLAHFRADIGSLDLAPFAAAMEAFRDAVGRMAAARMPAICEAARMPAICEAARRCEVEVFVERPGGGLAVGGYVEDLDWFRGLLAVRYGERYVSPPVTLRDGRRGFLFLLGAAVQDSPRWRMYSEIGEPGGR